MLGNLMDALMQPGPQGQPSAGADMLTQVVGGLMGNQGGGAPVNQLLGGLKQVMSSGGQPAAAEANSPLMGLLGPIASAVAGKVGISPAVATTVAATALHYLVSSHPAAGGNGPLNLTTVSQQMASGSVSSATLHDSGMVTAVVQATGLSPSDAAKSLDATFTHLSQSQVHAAKEAHRRKRQD